MSDQGWCTSGHGVSGFFSFFVTHLGHWAGLHGPRWVTATSLSHSNWREINIEQFKPDVPLKNRPQKWHSIIHLVSYNTDPQISVVHKKHLSGSCTVGSWRSADMDWTQLWQHWSSCLSLDQSLRHILLMSIIEVQESKPTCASTSQSSVVSDFLGYHWPYVSNNIYHENYGIKKMFWGRTSNLCQQLPTFFKNRFHTDYDLFQPEIYNNNKKR